MQKASVFIPGEVATQRPRAGLREGQGQAVGHTEGV